MKKLLTLFFAAALVIAFSQPAQAAGEYLGAPDFKFRMWVMNQGRDDNNVFDFEDDVHDNHRHIYQRFRWYLDTSFEGKYGATIGFQYDWIWGHDAYSAQKGTSPGIIGDPFTPTNSFGQGPHGGRWGVQGYREDGAVTPIADLSMESAYAWFFVPGTEAKLTVGLQEPIWDPDGFMWGTIGRAWAIRLDAPLVKGLLNMSAQYIKWDEGTPSPSEDGWHGGLDRDSEDSTIFGLKLSGTIDWFDWSQYTWWNHVSSNGYTSMADNILNLVNSPLTSASGVNQFMGGRDGYNALQGDYFWAGLTLKGTPWDLIYARLHFNYFWGYPDRYVDPVTVGGGATAPVVRKGSDDPNGWALFGRAGLNLGPATVGIRGWYFSGNNDDYIDPNDPSNPDRDYNRWTAPDTYFWSGFELFYSGARGWGTWDFQHSIGPGGTWAICLEGDWQVTKRLLFDLLAGGIWYTSEEDKFRSAWLNNAAYSDVFLFGVPIGTTPGGDSKDSLFAGFEFDLRATYKIYDNLTLDGVFAYLFTSSGLDHRNPMDPTDNSFLSGDNAYELFWRLVYSF
jgi:hypothetical protein